MPHDDNVGNYGSSLFPAEEARKIAILDIRILNCDRNEENILVRKKYYDQNYKRKIQQNSASKNPKQAYDYELIPIDHGYSFPDCFKICRDEVVWFHWDQMTQPFTEKEKEYIQKISPEEDISLLRKKLNFREICLRNFRISTMLLKIGTEYDLTIYDIACLLYREEPDQLSALEQSVREAEKYFAQGIRIPSHIREEIDSKITFKNKLCQKSLEIKNPLISEKHYNLAPKQQLLRPVLEEDKDNNCGEKVKKNILTRVSSQSSLTGTDSRKVSLEQRWDEDFYLHVRYFMQQIVEKVQSAKSPNKRYPYYRERYRSENFQ